MRRTHSKSILETFVIDDIEYSITDSKNAIVSKVLSSSKEVEIPSTVLHNEKEYDIVELGKKCIDESKIASLSFKSDSKIHTFNKDCLSSKTLFKLTIPNNLTTLKVDWCNNSRCLSQIQISDPNDSFCIDEKGALFDKDKTTLFFCPRNIKEYVIPKTVKRIREYAFEQCRVIKSLSFEEGSQIENIDNWAMASTSFPVLIFPNTIKTIGNNCFFWTKKLMQVSFSEGPNKIESIKNSVFKQSSLKSIEIPPSVKTLGIGVFQKCANLEKVTLLANNCQITIGRDCFSDTPETFRLVIFDSVTLVGDGVPGPELITIIADDKGVGSIETNSEIGESSHNSEKIKNKEKSKAEKSKKKDKSRKSEKSKKKSKSEKKSKKVKPYENKSENETKPENEIKSGKQILGGFNSHISDSELPSISEMATSHVDINSSGNKANSLTRKETESAQDEIAQDEIAQDELPQDEMAQDELSQDEMAQDEIAQDEMAQDEIAQDEIVQDELPQDEMAQDELPQDEMAQDELPQDEMAQDEIAQDEMAQDEIAQDEMAQDELPQDEMAQDELSQDGLPQDEMAQDELPQDEMAQDEMAQDELPQDEMAQDELSQDELPQDEMAQDELPQDEMAQDEMAQDELSQDGLPQDEIAQDEIAQDEMAQDEMAQDELSQDGLPQDEIAQDEIAQDEIAQDEISQDEMAQDEMAQDELPQDEMAQDELPQDEMVQDEIVQDEMAQDEMAQDELPQDEMAQDEMAQDEIAQDELPQDEIAQDELPQDEIVQDESSQDDIMNEDITNEDINNEDIMNEYVLPQSSPRKYIPISSEVLKPKLNLEFLEDRYMYRYNSEKISYRCSEEFNLLYKFFDNYEPNKMFSKSELMKALKSKFVSKANNLQDILDNIDFDNHDPTNLFNNLNNQLSEIVYDSDFTDIKFSSSNNYSLVHSTRGNCVYLKHHYDFEDHEIDKVYDIHDHPLVLNFGISSSKNIYTEFLYTNLSHFINSSKGAYFSNTQKAIIALEIALALQFAHRKGVIHGQLIPETIWLDDRGKVKLDFTKEKLDIFLIGSQLTFFFAPNIIKGDKPTEKDDIYSFGTILYALNSMTVPIITKYEEPRNIPITGNSTMQNIITQCLKDNPTSRISLDEIIQIMIDSDFQIFDNVDSIFVLERYRKIRKFEKSLTA